MSQSYSSHAKWVPAYHFFVLPVLLINAGWCAYQAFRGPSFGTIFGTVVAFSLFLAALYGRIFALKVQDRLIRLEMMLRLQKLLPSDLQARIGDLTAEQMIGLRFASDGELPELCRKVLQENITGRAPIKQMVKNWQADHLRA